jgi:hypothetical protein
MKKCCKIVHMNSKFRKNYYNTTSTNFSYKFPNMIKDVVSMKLRSIDIPNSWYTISENFGNTKFFIVTHKRKINKIDYPQLIKERFSAQNDRKIEKLQSNDKKNTQVKQTFEINIPEGNWAPEKLEKYINETYFIDKGNEISYLRFSIDDFNHSVFETMFETPEDYKFTLIFAGNKFDKDFDKNRPITKELGWTLGFRYAKYENIKKAVISETPYDELRFKYVFFSLEDYQYNRTDAHTAFLLENSVDKDILGKIYLSGYRFYITISDDRSRSNTRKRDYFSPVNISRINIKILDEYGNIIDLNNMDFSFALEFICLVPN